MTSSHRIDLAFLIGNLNKEHGGAQRLLYDICRNLPGSEFESTVYYMFGDGTFQPALEKEGVTVVDLDASSNYDIRTFGSLVSRLRGAGHDLLQTNSPISGVWGRAAGRLAGVPTLISVEHNLHDTYGPLTRYANGLTLPLADAAVCVSHSVADSLLTWEHPILRSVDVRTIVNGVDVDAIESTFDACESVLSDQTDLSVDDTIVGTFGRFLEQKGFEYLVRAFPAVLDAHPDAQLLLIGDGPERQRVQRLAHEIGLGDAVSFPGHVPEIYPLLPAIDVAVFPSLWEGLPLAPAETMVARRPLVVTDIPPFAELVGDAGITVPTRDSEAVAEAVVSLLDSPEQRRDLGEAAYERVTDAFSIERTVEEYTSLYRDLS